MADPNGDYPPHIQNHIARINRLSASKSPGSNSDSATSPSGPSDTSSGSRFEINLDFLKIGSNRNKDGEKPKRRGPKPDSKPALTRRQELNRQAQRTHRERKEKYVKTLEEEVVRLREAFTIITKEKTHILEENRRLKELLEAHGIPYDNNFAASGAALQRQQTIQQAPEVSRFNQTYDEIGVDFVLAHG
jgi:hypothetical protein